MFVASPTPPSPRLHLSCPDIDLQLYHNNAMTNRRDRRTQARGPSPTAATIPHTRASDDPRNATKPTKTLLDIAAERQTLAAHLPQGAKITSSNVLNVTIDNAGNVRTLDGSPLPPGLSTQTDAAGNIVASSSSTDPTDAAADADDELSPLLDTLLLSLPLTAVHFTLAVLTMHQYAMTLSIPPLLKESTLVAFPVLTLLVHLSRGHMLPASFRRTPSPGAVGISEIVRTTALVLRGLVYLVTANVAGCYLLRLTHDRGYYAVMKKAPAVGTVWVWAVLEMRLGGALAGVVGPAAYAWWNGYGL
jgi:hypothetical protein